jgi:hypothetical protein
MRKCRWGGRAVLLMTDTQVGLHRVAWRGVAWRGVAWRGVAWRGVAWRWVRVVCASADQIGLLG